MMKGLSLILLVSSVWAGTIIKSDLVGEYIDGGDKVTHNTNRYGVNFPVPGAIWIWGPNARRSPHGQVIVFRQSFNLFCDSAITFYATADNVFNAKINGEPILSGNWWPRVYSTTFDPKTKSLNTCGQNILEITATNYHSGSPAGLIYGLVQDQSCISCGAGFTFNFDKCKCDCPNYCGCESPHEWSAYPKCSCQCKERKQCSECSYFDENTCECEKIPQVCGDKKFWNQKRSKCECKEWKKCDECKPFNQDTCQCQ